MKGETQQDVEVIELDLLREMKTATESVIDYSRDFNEVDEEKPEIDTKFENDFTEEYKQEEHPHKYEEEPEEEQADESDIIGLQELMENTEELSGLLVEGLDSVLSFTLPMAMEKTFSKSERKNLKELAKKYRQAKTTNSTEFSLQEKEQDTMELYLNFEEYKESLPFSETDKERLTKRLSIVLANMNFKITPETALMFTAAAVAAPRLAPILLNKFKK